MRRADGVSTPEWPAEALLDSEAVARELAPPPRYDDICVLTVRFD